MMVSVPRMDAQPTGDQKMCVECRDWEAELSTTEVKPGDLEAVKVHSDASVKHISL